MGNKKTAPDFPGPGVVLLRQGEVPQLLRGEEALLDRVRVRVRRGVDEGAPAPGVVHVGALDHARGPVGAGVARRDAEVGTLQDCLDKRGNVIWERF